MNKWYFIPLFLFLFYSCKSAPGEIPEEVELPVVQEEAQKEYRWGVYISQFRETNLREGKSVLVPLAKAPFRIIFPVNSYNAAEGNWYAVKILATQNPLQQEMFQTGTELGTFPGLRPGTGLSTGDGPYESINVREDAHHYIVYDPEDPAFQRGRLLETRDQLNLLVWEIDTVTYLGKEYSIYDIPTPGFTIILVNDMNLNGIADSGEWYKAELRFTE